MRAPLIERATPVVDGLRATTAHDVPALATLLLAGYRGTVDYEGEDAAAALVEIQRTFAGEYGEFVPTCSRVVERDGALRSATLVTRWEARPFITFTVTDPSYQRTGLARACLVSAMQGLRAAGESEVRLAVTLANEPALRLYESLGFIAFGP